MVSDPAEDRFQHCSSRVEICSVDPAAACLQKLFYPITRKSVRERPLLWSASTCYITCLQYRNQYTGSLIDLMVWRPCPIMSAFPTIR